MGLNLEIPLGWLYSGFRTSVRRVKSLTPHKWVEPAWDIPLQANQGVTMPFCESLLQVWNGAQVRLSFRIWPCLTADFIPTGCQPETLFRPLLRYCAYSSARLSDHKSQLRYLHQEKCCVPSREPNVLWFYLNWNPSPTRCFWQDLMIDFYQSWQLGQLPRWQETGCGALPAKLMCAPKNVHFSRDVEAFSSHVNKN